MSQINIMVGGEAGQGVQSVGFILARMLVRGGYQVFADQDYESRVRGGHNFFRIRAAEKPVTSFNDKIDILIALNRESVDLHNGELSSNGIVVGDVALQPITDEKSQLVNTEEVFKKTKDLKQMSNTVVLGFVTGLLGYDISAAEEIIKNHFGGDAGVLNAEAARKGYEMARGRSTPLLEFSSSSNKHLFINGNEAIAIGALAAGCRFVSAYPMTPVTSIMEYMAGKVQETGCVVVQPEDEIAAINSVIGASYAGVRSMTATSGGGFCLMVEGLSLAGMTETPVVVVLGQRPGPAIGLPTRTEQGELLFAINAGHGEFPRAILTPGNAEEAFWHTVHAFNLADRYQSPVMVMTDHVLASSYFTIEPPRLRDVNIDRGDIIELSSRFTKDYKRHLFTDSGISPRAFPLQAQDQVVCTDSDEHDESGHLIEDSETRKKMVDKRMAKMSGLSRDVLPPVRNGPDNPDILLIGWGSTRGAIDEAAGIMSVKGIKASSLHLGQVWPFPEETVSDAIKASRASFVIENNASGQLSRLIMTETGFRNCKNVMRYDGRPFSPLDIVSAVTRGPN